MHGLFGPVTTVRIFPLDIYPHVQRMHMNFYCNPTYNTTKKQPHFTRALMR
jgi:hypothetical protein